MDILAHDVLGAGIVTVGTTVQGKMGLLQEFEFDHVIADEASVLSDASLLCAFRGMEALTLIDDIKQLAAITRTTKLNNPHPKTIELNPLALWIMLNVPYFLLTDKCA